MRGVEEKRGRGGQGRALNSFKKGMKNPTPVFQNVFFFSNLVIENKLLTDEVNFGEMWQMKIRIIYSATHRRCTSLTRY